eukprot:m.105780 g.105780  ORF g.105780 m.105780 type:complete len:57 (-) comp9139_c0_seq1:5-175(-)
MPSWSFLSFLFFSTSIPQSKSPLNCCNITETTTLSSSNVNNNNHIQWKRKLQQQQQ